MPNVIDTLIVELALDPTKFTTAQQQAVAQARQATQQLLQQANQIEAAGKRMENFFTGLKRQAITVFGAFFGGREFVQFMEHITTFDAALARSARTLDMNVTELNAWQGVARATGGSAEGMAASMQNLTGQVQRGLVTGQWGSLLQIFNQFGIRLRDANGRLKDAGQLILDLNEKFAGVDPARARAILQMLGMDENTINIVLMNRNALRDLYGEMRKNAAATQEDTEAATRLFTAWEKVATAAENFGRKIRNALEPFLTPIFNKLADLFGAGAHAMTSEGTQERMAGNAQNFLAGISFLESGYNTRASNQGHRGAFQFDEATAQQAITAGIGDPREGDWQTQAARTWAFIQKFHPDAAKAIQEGNFPLAEVKLGKRWTSLPGAKEDQGAARDATFEKILQGMGPRPPGAPAAAAAAGSSTSTTNTSSATTNVNGPINIVVKDTGDASQVAGGVRGAMKRVGLAFPANTGAQ